MGKDNDIYVRAVIKDMTTAEFEKVKNMLHFALKAVDAARELNGKINFNYTITLECGKLGINAPARNKNTATFYAICIKHALELGGK